MLIPRSGRNIPARCGAPTYPVSFPAGAPECGMAAAHMAGVLRCAQDDNHCGGGAGMLLPLRGISMTTVMEKQSRRDARAAASCPRRQTVARPSTRTRNGQRVLAQDDEPILAGASSARHDSSIRGLWRSRVPGIQKPPGLGGFFFAPNRAAYILCRKSIMSGEVQSAAPMSLRRMMPLRSMM